MWLVLTEDWRFSSLTAQTKDFRLQAILSTHSDPYVLSTLSIFPTAHRRTGAALESLKMQ